MSPAINAPVVPTHCTVISSARVNAGMPWSKTRPCQLSVRPAAAGGVWTFDSAATEPDSVGPQRERAPGAIETPSEMLDYQRGRLRVIEHVQIVYGLPADEAEHRVAAPKMAPLPPKPFENCIASALLLAWIPVQRYCNHLPLYRQQRIFEHDGPP